MSANGNGRADLAELREQLHWAEKALAAVDDGEDLELRQDWKHARDRAALALAVAAFEAQAARDGLRKSGMDAAAISRFIRNHPAGAAAGAAAFRALPK